MTDRPLVTIGLPTHNRERLLRRAIDSALAQTHAPIELVISDNASTDNTEALCRSVAARDPRVRYLRHAHDLGPTDNFNHLFGACSGDYVLLLADDDWLDAGYVAACLEALQADDSVALVAGRARYMRDGMYVYSGVVHEHWQPDAPARVADYLATVDDNGVFYGLMPRLVLQRAGALPNVLGNDWIHMARIAYQGRIHTLATVHVNRELGGTSVDVQSILATFGGARWQAWAPQLVIAGQVLRDIGWGHQLYASLGRGHRLALGVRAAVASIRWPDLAWHIVTPLVALFAGRRRGRAIWNLYLRFARALGAGRRP